jgi:hypothetical protein
VRGDWRKLLTEEHQNLNSLLNIIMVIKLSNMMWAEHAAFMAEKISA